MALVKTDNTIVSIRRRFGGVYFKTGSDGIHVQAMPRRIMYTRSYAQRGCGNPKSEGSFFGIDGFSTLTTFWMLVLLGLMAAAWAAYALKNKFTTKTGEQKRITGFNWYIHYGLTLGKEEGWPFWKPPHAPGELPEYHVNYMGYWIYEHNPTEWPEDCCADQYWVRPDFNGYPAYVNDARNWNIWFNGERWVISKLLGMEEEQTTFYRSDVENGHSINGYYYNDFTHKWAHCYFSGGKHAHDIP